MGESISVNPDVSKEEQYKTLLPQLRALIEPEDNLVANLANIAAALKQSFDFFWVGFYLQIGEELVLGPFQGPVACSRIAMGKGVCGTAAQQQKPIIVPDVHKFPGHIACNAASKSEIVLPLVVHKSTRLVLDVDEVFYNAFDRTDERFLAEILADIKKQHFTL